jgi:hypothetical protein
MTYCVEPFIQDTVWRWLSANDRYKRVSAEIQIGDGVSSGRIDLIAETINGKIHGFEIKDYAFADEQINRYLESGWLDRLYHCSRRGHTVMDRLNKDQSYKSHTYESQQIRKEVGNAIAAGQYTESDYIDRLESAFPENMLEQKALGLWVVNKRVLDEDEKTIRSLLTKNIGIPTADFDPSQEYLDLDEAIELLMNEMNLPDSVGVLDIPFSYDKSNSAEDSFRNLMDEPTNKAFSKSRWQEIEVCREAEPLSSERNPDFSRTNEAWVQHHTWQEMGDIREAVVPHPDLDSEFLIDIMYFEGGNTPTDIFRAGGAGRCIGIEAKGAAEFRSTADHSDVRSQLERYRSSGALTHLYLSVPEKYRREGEQILKEHMTEVGLITVDETGTVTTVRDSSRLEMDFDGYLEVSGKYEYTRSIGFGRLKPSDEGEPMNPCRVRKTEKPS